MSLPNPPVCENKSPFCSRSGMTMKCVNETEQEWVFACVRCGQVNVITKPEYRRHMREAVRRASYGN